VSVLNDHPASNQKGATSYSHASRALSRALIVACGYHPGDTTGGLADLGILAALLGRDATFEVGSFEPNAGRNTD
jgi:hypothetical protein